MKTVLLFSLSLIPTAAAVLTNFYRTVFTHRLHAKQPRHISLLLNATATFWTNPLDLEAHNTVSFRDGTVKIYFPYHFLFLAQNNATISGNIDFRCSSGLGELDQLHSNSKSGQDFWMTRNKAFIVKSISHSESLHFRKMFADYFALMKAAQGNTAEPTTVSEVVGMYRVRRRFSWRRKYFVICKNAFPSTSLECFDLKGSTVGRLAGPTSPVQKDLDLLRSGKIFLLDDENRALLLRALQRDTAFLRKHGCIDYSLLVSVVEPSRQVPVSDGMESSDGSSRASDTVERTQPLRGGALQFPGKNGTQQFCFGLIDLFVRFGWKKRVEMFLKGLVYDRSALSCVPPDIYAQRLIDFIANVTSPEESPRLWIQ